MTKVVLLGNSNPIHHYPEGPRRSDHQATAVTRVELWDGIDDPEWVEHTLTTGLEGRTSPTWRNLHNLSRALGDEHRQYAVAINEIEQLFVTHTGGVQPAWVECEDEGLQAAIAAYYGIMEGQPIALLVNAGRDAIHQQMMTTSTQPAAFNYMALANQSSATTPASTDTTLAGEITTAGGGLIRAQATFAHTTGTNTSTLTKTFTANGSDSLPVTVSQIGVFNASSGGTLFIKTALSGTATLTVSGDNVTITSTVLEG